MSISATLPRLEIRPASRRNAILVAVGCGVFVIFSLEMISTGGWKNIAIGILGLLFFGVGGLIAIPRLFRRKVSLVLSPEGAEQRSIYGNATIHWEDVEDIGVVSLMGQKMVGLRLHSYDRYLNEMSPELAGWMAKSIPYLKWMARFTSMVSVPLELRLWSKLASESDPKEALRSFGKVGTYAEMLMWQRNLFGYDILLGWSDLDRSTQQFTDLLRSYWRPQ